jgi:hypothetical protein
VLITTCVALLLVSIRVTSLAFVVDWNGEILRKTTERGFKYCGLNDSCILMKANLAIVVALISTALGLVAATTSFITNRGCCRPHEILSYARRRSSSAWASDGIPLGRAALLVSVISPRASAIIRPALTTPQPRMRSVTVSANSLAPCGLRAMTSFEEHCLGAPFSRLFKDCEDFAYVSYRGKSCTSVEALLLTGYLFYGEHIYQATSVVMLLLARLLPRKLLRTFNVLLLRWYVDPVKGTVTHAQSCTWYHASEEHYWLEEATPVA